LELLNPTSVFKNIMIDFDHIECTSSCIQALCQFKEISNYRRNDIDKSIKNGVNFMKKIQLDDGGWYGFLFFF
jgi:squalene cyclase